MRALYISVFGILPLGLDLAVICYALVSDNSNLAFIAMWAILLAIPCCAFTFSIACGSVAVYSKIPGSLAKKFAASAFFVATAYFIAGVLVFWYWHHQQFVEEARRVESKAVEAFVAADPGVTALFHSTISSGVVAATLGSSNPWPVRYEVLVKGDREIYAIVDVDRSSVTPKLKVICTTHIGIGHRESGVDPCAQ